LMSRKTLQCTSIFITIIASLCCFVVVAWSVAWLGVETGEGGSEVTSYAGWRRVKLFDLYPWIDGRPLSANYRLEIYGLEPERATIVTWSHGVDKLKEAVGLGVGEVLLPRTDKFRLVAEFEALSGPHLSWEADITGIVREAERVSLLSVIYPRALEEVKRMASEASSRLRALSESGIYLGYQEKRLVSAEKLIGWSESLFSHGKLTEAYKSLRQAYIDLTGVISVISSYEGSIPTTSLALSFFLVLGAFVFSIFIIGDNVTRILLLTVVLSSLTLGFTALSNQSILPRDAWSWSILLYSTLLLIGMVFVLRNVGVDVKTHRGVALLGAATLAFSMAKRFLRSRPIRTWIMVAMASITVSSVLLLVNSSVAGGVFISAPLERVEQPGETYIVAYSRDYRFDNLSPINTGYIYFVEGLGLKVGARAETPISPPTGNRYLINGRDYYLKGIVGVTGDVPFLNKLANCLIEGGIEDLIRDNTAAIISRDIADTFQTHTGSFLNVNGRTLRVVGIIGTDCYTYLKDVDGYFASTLIQPPQSPISPSGWSNIIVTGLRESLVLGAKPTKIYASGINQSRGSELAYLISLHTGLKVRLIEPSGEVSLFNLVSLTGVSGVEVMVVVVIAFLNLLVAAIANYYERRGEFLTLSTLGLNPAHIVLLSISEAVILAIISSYLGSLMAIAVLGIAPSFSHIPIDFKLSPESVSGALMMSTLIFIAAHTLSVRKSIIQSTPAHAWKWSLVATLDDEGYWVVGLPARIKASRIRHFMTYLSSRLGEYSYTTTVKIDVQGVDEDMEAKIFKLRFIYSSTEKRSFRASCILEVSAPKEWGEVILKSRIEAQELRFHEQCVREVVQLLRQLIMDFTALTVRVLVPLSRDMSHIHPLLNVYSPNEVKIVCKGSKESELMKAAGELEEKMVRVVVVRLGSESTLADDAKTVLEVAKSCDLICISSDDGYLSSLALLAAQRLDKRVCIVRGSEVIETTPLNLYEYLR